MKKIFILLGAAISLGFARAASVDWVITGRAGDVGKSVYLLTSLADSYDSVDKLTASALGWGTIESQGRTYGFSEELTKDAITKDSLKEAYLVIIQGDEYTYLQVDMSDYVYYPNSQETSPESFTKSYSDIAAGTTRQFGPVPEPTSGLLMLLGAAGLALRRKRS